MISLKFTHLSLLVLVSFCSLQAEEKKHANLGWLGFLHLPKAVHKEDKKVQVQTPKLWKNWSDKEGYKVDWFAKPQKDYQENVHFYLLLDQAKGKLKSSKSRRWNHLNER